MTNVVNFLNGYIIGTMTEEHKIRRSAYDWFVTLSKVMFFVVAFFLVIFTVMANMGGNSDTLKQSIEQYLAETTGLVVKIETLGKMTFFPNISIDVEKIHMYRPDVENQPAVTIGRLFASISFASVAFGKKQIKGLELEDLTASPGVLNAQEVFFENAGILGAEEEGKAFFQGRGKLGAHEVNFEIGMLDLGKAYKFGADRPFKASVGDLKAQGIMAERSGRVFVQDLSLGFPEEFVTGKFDFTRKAKGKLRVEGDIKFGASGTVKPNIVIERRERARIVTGTLDVAVSDMKDITGEKGFLAAYDKFVSVWGPAVTDEKDKGKKSGHDELDVNFTAPAGCIHLTHENFDKVIEGWRSAAQIPTAQQIADYPCGGTSP